MAVNQAISQLAQFRSEMELVIAEMRRMRGEMGTTKSMSGVGGGSGGTQAITIPGGYQSLAEQGFMTGNAAGTPGQGLSGWDQIYPNYTKDISTSTEDQFYKQMTQRKYIAMAGQINALVSIVGKGLGADQEIMQNITSGVSNAISTVSWIFTAGRLLSYITAPAMIVMGTALIAFSWIDYFQKLTEMDPIYKMGGNSKAHVINGQVMYN